jgi:hypothetical protein
MVDYIFMCEVASGAWMDSGLGERIGAWLRLKLGLPLCCFNSNTWMRLKQYLFVEKYGTVSTYRSMRYFLYGLQCNLVYCKSIVSVRIVNTMHFFWFRALMTKKTIHQLRNDEMLRISRVGQNEGTPRIARAVDCDWGMHTTASRNAMPWHKIAWCKFSKKKVYN